MVTPHGHSSRFAADTSPSVSTPGFKRPLLRAFYLRTQRRDGGSASRCRSVVQVTGLGAVFRSWGSPARWFPTALSYSWQSIESSCSYARWWVGFVRNINPRLRQQFVRPNDSLQPRSRVSALSVFHWDTPARNPSKERMSCSIASSFQRK